MIYQALFPEGLTIDVLGDNVSANPLDAYREFDPKVIESYNRLQELVLLKESSSRPTRPLQTRQRSLAHSGLLQSGKQDSWKREP